MSDIQAAVKKALEEKTQEELSAIAAGEDDENPQKELSIEEEYQLWRKNCPLMYEFVSETALTWPSLTVQWLPDQEVLSTGIKHRILLGTHTSGEDTDYLKIASTQLPKSLVDTNGKQQQQEEGPADYQKQGFNARLKVNKKFKHQDEVNRARYQPQDPTKIGTINGSGKVFIYDTTLESKEPIFHLEHHTENGYGISWNKFNQGQLLTSSDDKTVALWDINNQSTSTITPKHIFKHHSDIVNDVQWHNHNANVFGSVSEDKTIQLFDIRTSLSTPLHLINRHAAVNTISFSLHSSNLFAVGLDDATIELFDIRNPSKKLHTIMGHSESITSLEWDPHNDGIIASGSQDRRVILWDIKKIGEEQIQEDEDDGAPELFMMHAGHTSGITDLSFNPNIPWTLATSSDDNIVHLWKVAKKLTNEYHGIVEEDIDYNQLE
ncbi:putative WD repeat-containing protein [Wickerhamomyces ciferrii]|uniref:WD repeat-containing protein n=1 Tax=Wickerhamomyces ciferrii (strain ATCC 14091 / BCRC 22168 / CBS 111 / JCM 3599 / NBRC 0793 / NRRL Y-1031 F-60-10) TaxID=1206466 RepID=K0L0F0_WICCF|nr:putative WD repeat-containing protein [Wickerhamomyces ciferrii]CCH46908.1 putative WD repeat-containing protein [Wickerhamomyces ciferrii]